MDRGSTYPPRLHIVTPIFNPRRYKRRYELYGEFAKMVADAGAVLHTVELALGERDFMVTERGNPFHHQFRSRDEWFCKENLVNLGFSRLPANVEYMAWVDADVRFADPAWASETVEMLQHHPIVQMFSKVVNLTPSDEPFQIWNGFASSFMGGEQYSAIQKGYSLWHPGFAWAYRRDAIQELGGLMDRAILGSADSHMAAALVGEVDKTLHGKSTDAFKTYVSQWEENAQRYLTRRGEAIGCVKGLLTHYWHGRMKDRRYVERWDILVKHGFDPFRDLRPDLDGLLHLTDRVYGLRRDCQAYLSARNEDCIYYDASESNLHPALPGG